MKINCLFGKHRVGLPRMNEDGVLEMECMRCMKVSLSPVAFPPDSDTAIQFNARRALAIASLVAQNTWVGLVSNVPRKLASRKRARSGFALTSRAA